MDDNNSDKNTEEDIMNNSPENPLNSVVRPSVVRMAETFERHKGTDKSHVENAEEANNSLHK